MSKTQPETMHFKRLKCVLKKKIARPKNPSTVSIAIATAEQLIIRRLGIDERADERGYITRDCHGIAQQSICIATGIGMTVGSICAE